PRPWLQFPLSLMQMTTTHNPTTPTTLPMNQDKILLSLRRLLRLLWGSSPIYPSATRRDKINPHLALDTPGPSSLDPSSPLREPPVGIQTAISPPWNIFTPQQPHTHTLLHKISLFQILGLSWSPVNMMSRNRTLITHTNQILRPVTFYEHFLTREERCQILSFQKQIAVVVDGYSFFLYE
ncbi:hypothetical protein BGY98DRAFT_1048303, partial [Russula aff. rugulosa BPL654]